MLSESCRPPAGLCFSTEQCSKNTVRPNIFCFDPRFHPMPNFSRQHTYTIFCRRVAKALKKGSQTWFFKGFQSCIRSLGFSINWVFAPCAIVPSNRNSLASGSVPQCKIGTWKTCRLHALYFKICRPGTPFSNNCPPIFETSDCTLCPQHWGGKKCTI